MDSVLREAGECGRFQACHVFFTQLPRFVTVWAVFLMMFGSYDPGWKCVSRSRNRFDTNITSHDDATTNTSTKITQAAGVLSSLIDGRNRNRNYVPGTDTFKTNSDTTSPMPYMGKGLSRSNRTLDDNNRKNSNDTKEDFNEECQALETCEEIEFNTESVTVVSRFQLVCDRAWMVKCILLLQGVGYFFGALIGGQVGERFGRKIGLYGSTLIVCVSSGLAIFSPHWSVYALCIFFLGLGANGVISLVSVFSVELLNSKWRGYFGSIPTWNISLLLFTLTTAAVKNWIYLHLFTFGMALISCVGFVIVVESPRWLVVNGRPKRAEEAVRKIARINGKPQPNFDRRLLQLQADRKEEEDGEECECVDSRKTYTYLDLFRTKEIRTLALKLSVLMGSFGIIYYALGWGVKSLPGDFYVNAVVSSVTEIANLLLVGPLCNKIGRRKAGVFMAVMGTVSCFSIVIALFAAEEGSTLQANVIKVFAFEGKAASQAIFIITSLFIVELLPTVVRNVGVGFCRCVAGLGALLAPFLIPSSDVISFAVCFALLCVLFAVQIGIFLSLPETKNLDLPDSLVRNNGNDKESMVDPPELVVEEKEDWSKSDSVE